LEKTLVNIADKFSEIRKRTVEICEPLELEDYIPQPVVYISPPKWHLGHTTWFYEAFILSRQPEGFELFDSKFGFLFNSYYNNIGDRIMRADRGNLTRPSVKKVIQYRDYINREILKLLEERPTDSNLIELVTLGLNHEQQHQELMITDLKFILGSNPIFPVYKDTGTLLEDQNQNEGWIRVEAGVFDLGHNGDGFAYDNELGHHKVYINSFSISNSLVTNGDYLDFIEAGGYDDFNYWLDEGWTWVKENKVNSPLYWHKISNDWHQFSLGGLKRIEKENILCHVNYYEAEAFAQWKGLRLPTEAEWELASDKFSWGKRWEWTQSAYLPYPGFKKAPGAVGEYNGKFMVNQMVLRGASVATSPGHSRKSYRNFFHPHLQWQFSGIRLAK
jgi:ergothioneine biosynthesis protein EgtB